MIEGVGVAWNNIFVKQQMLMMHDMSKLNEERVNRIRMGLPDYTQEEIQEKLLARQPQQGGFFGGLLSRG